MWLSSGVGGCGKAPIHNQTKNIPYIKNVAKKKKKKKKKIQNKQKPKTKMQVLQQISTEFVHINIAETLYRIPL